MAQLTVPRSRRMVIAMKAETTYGVDVLGTNYGSTDIVPCFDIAVDRRIDEIQNLSMAGDIGRLPSIMGIESGQVAFSMYPRGAGAAYSASVKPEVHKPLEACAMIGTLDATGGSEKYTYSPGTPSSYTIWIVQENGKVLKLVGCLGTFDLSGRAGGVGPWRFTFQGKIGSIVDLTFVAGSISSTPAYPVLKSAAWQIGSGNYAPRIASLTATLGNTISPVPSINDSTGLVGYFISDRNPRMTIDPEADTVANFDWDASLSAGTLHDVTFQIGTVQYNRVLFQFGSNAGSQMQVVATSWGTRDGLTSYPTSLLATIASGSDDLAIVFS